jgi:DNA recombination protein RmuC
MNGWVGFVLVAVVAAVAAWALAVWLRGRMEAQMSAHRQEMQSSLAAQSQAVSSSIAELRLSVTQQLGQVTQALQTGVATSGQLVTGAQEAFGEQLRRSTEMLGTIRQQLGEVQQAGRELSQASQALQTVLGGAKTRGTLGEVALERLLEDTLPRSAYEFQYTFATGAVVDAIVRSGNRILPLDSKFPLDSYRRLVEGGEEARKEFAQAVRKHADSIAEKYILPSESTLDIALMFVPSESVYYELLMTEDSKGGRLDAYSRGRGVIPVSPNTLHAYLSAILMGLKGMQVEENARQLLGSIAGLKKQFDTFTEVYERLGTHLRHAQQSYQDADAKLLRARNALEQVAQGALPEAPAKALEPATKE